MDCTDLVDSSLFEGNDEYQPETIADIATSLPTIKLPENYEEPIFKTWEPSEGFLDNLLRPVLLWR